MGSRTTIPVTSSSTTTTPATPAPTSSGGRASMTTRPGLPIISKIPTSPPVFAADTSDFSGYVQQQLGDLGTGTDGWDALINPIVTAAAIEIASLGDLDTLLSALAFNEGDFASTYFAPVDALLPSLLEDGDALNSGVQGLDLVTGTVTIVTPPAPPIDIGGGSDQGGGGDQGGNGPGPPIGEPQPPWDIPVSYYF